MGEFSKLINILKCNIVIVNHILTDGGDDLNIEIELHDASFDMVSAKIFANLLGEFLIGDFINISEKRGKKPQEETGALSPRKKRTQKYKKGSRCH